MPTSHSKTLKELANLIKCDFEGDPSTALSNASSMTNAQKDSIVFISEEKYLTPLTESNAGAVVVSPGLAKRISKSKIISNNPYRDFIKLVELFNKDDAIFSIASSARIHPTANVADNVLIGNHVVIGQGSTIKAGTKVHANSVIGKNVFIDENATISSNVTIYSDTQIGTESKILAGSVIGSQGFGYLEDAEGWIEIPHIGKVVIGKQVMIGANCTIDRGTLDDTVIEDGVKLDNLIHIAHNVKLGRNTAIAATSAIAGSTMIGANCKIAGRVSIMGHLSICDDVTITSNTLITKSIDKKGTYSSGIPATEAGLWRKMISQLKLIARKD